MEGFLERNVYMVKICVFYLEPWFLRLALLLVCSCFLTISILDLLINCHKSHKKIVPYKIDELFREGNCLNIDVKRGLNLIFHIGLPTINILKHLSFCPLFLLRLFSIRKHFLRDIYPSRENSPKNKKLFRSHSNIFTLFGKY